MIVLSVALGKKIRSDNSDLIELSNPKVITIINEQMAGDRTGCGCLYQCL